MKIITHPANKHLVEKEIEKRQPKNCSILYFNSIEVIYDEMMEKEKWTGKYKVLQNKFYKYWDGEGEPPSWCLYFGFVKKEMEPIIYIIDKKKTIFNPFTSAGMWGIENRRILTNYA